VPIGIGDDCAMISPPAGAAILTSVDTFTEGVHFFSGTNPKSIGHKALAVNLSDLAACGAQPLGCLLALSLPTIDDIWLDEFSQGFRALASAHGCPLIGGDTTRSAPGSGVSITVTVFGMVPDPSMVIRRNTAQVGDDIWIADSLGAAAAAVAVRYQRLSPNQLNLLACDHALDYPQPQLLLGQSLRKIASAAIDVSDGLVADLTHILRASAAVDASANSIDPSLGTSLGACLQARAIPVDIALHALPERQALNLALYGGDDYRLCFTASPKNQQTIQNIAQTISIPLHRIGRIVATAGVTLEQRDANESLQELGYEHFR
jgi:thiamine-monophosphate kinase